MSQAGTNTISGVLSYYKFILEVSYKLLSGLKRTEL
jgi:hypothetical protein